LPRAYIHYHTDTRFTGEPTTYAYTTSLVDTTSGFTNGIQRVNLKTGVWDTHAFGNGKFANEPVFVPRAASSSEGNGFLLTYVYVAAEHRSELVILDAERVGDAPLAVIKLPFHVPHSFHGTWTGDVYLQ
jgi:carotenoid cleavage dioxygenase-like enzyme